MSDFWKVFLISLIGAILFFGVSMLFNWMKDHGSQADPDAYEGCITKTGCIGVVILLIFIINLIIGIVGLF